MLSPPPNAGISSALRPVLGLRRGNTSALGLLVSLLGGVALPLPAAAQDAFSAFNALPSVTPAPTIMRDVTQMSLDERIGVLQRPRPDFDPLGVRYGDFILLPDVTSSIGGDSNLFTQNNAKKSDYSITSSAGFLIQSDLPTNALNVDLNYDNQRYLRYVSENISDFGGSATARLDISNLSYLTFSGGYQTQHEDRSSPDVTIQGLTPTAYHIATGRLGYARTIRRIGLSMNVEADKYNFINGLTLQHTPLINDFQNRLALSMGPRLSYSFAPEYSAYVEVKGNIQSYANNPDPSGFYHSSSGVAGYAGTDLRLTDVINGELYLGYQQQDYQDHRLKSVSEPLFGVSAVWNLTGLTTLRFGAARTIEETIVPGVPAFLQTQVEFGVEHELLENVLLNGQVGEIDEGLVDSDHTDEYYDVVLGVRYLIDNHFNISMNYERNVESAYTLANCFNRNRLNFKLHVQL